MDINRRKILKVVTILSLLPPSAIGSLSRRKRSEVMEAIESNRQSGINLRKNIAQMGGELNTNSLEYFLTNELTLRNDLHLLLRDLEHEELESYVLEEQSSLLTSLKQEDIPLLPTSADLTLRWPPHISAKVQCNGNDSLPSILVDIMLEWFDLQEFEASLKLIIEKTPELRVPLDTLAKAIELRDWEQVVDTLLVMLNFLSTVGFVDLGARVVGKPKVMELYRAILSKLSARFVPFVGQVYAGITLALAVYNNRLRLINIAQC